MVKPISDFLLKSLRACFKNSNLLKEEIYAYIVPHNDAHQNEYISLCDNRLQHISGFTGSYGTAIVTQTKAALWTDGRYHVQAENQIDLTSWNLMKEGLDDVPTKEEWLFNVCPAKSKIGVDPTLISNCSWKGLETALQKKQLCLVPITINLIDFIWADRPATPSHPVFPLHLSYSGVDWQSKVEHVLRIMGGQCGIDGSTLSPAQGSKADHILFSALDEIAWLLNLRGADIQYNPVFYAYALLSKKSIEGGVNKTAARVTLFFREGYQSLQQYPEVLEHLGMTNHTVTKTESDVVKSEAQMDDDTSNNINGDNVINGCKVNVLPYDRLWSTLKNLEFPNPESKIWLSSDSSQAIYASLPAENIFSSISPVLNLKSIKNGVELEGAKKAHLLDAVSLCQTFAWLENKIASRETVTEIGVADQLLQFKEDLGPEFRGLSFDTISSTGPNAAIIHYKPTKETDRPLCPNEIFLCDSGGQYLSGTTDVTRTLYFGQEPTDHMKECYTRVLKGHLALSTAIFPNNVKGARLDTLSRVPLWEVGLDYLHGTGHGVGSFLNVHEGPVLISTRPRSLSSLDEMGMREHMLVTVEPGYYETDNFGIRIENTCYVTKASTKYNFGDVGYLTLKPLTLVPYQTKLMDISLLTQDEIMQINDYHASCRDIVGKTLLDAGKKDALNWLLKETVPLNVN